MALLELDGVEKGFPWNGDVLSVLRDVHLTIEPGEFVAVLGPSASGKSTLISLLGGLLTPDRGEVRFDGHILTGPQPDRGIVIHNYTVLPWMTVFENVFLAVDAASPYLTVALKRQRAEYYLRLAKLGDVTGRLPRDLNPVMRQRLALARGWAMDPAALLLDDPFTTLETRTRATLQRELARLHALHRKTVVMATSDLDEALALADRIVILGSRTSASVRATVRVALGRPRPAGQMRGHGAYERLRRDVLEVMLSPDAAAATARTRKAG